MSPTYTISDLAREFGITTRTIRYYEDISFISPSREGLKRIYTDKDRILLKLILRGKRLGFSLSESRGILALYEPKGNNLTQLHTMMELIKEKREAMKRQLEDIELMQSDLAEAEVRIGKAICVAGSHDPNSDQETSS